MRPSATSAPAAQDSEAPIRVARGSVVGYQLRPRKRASVKRELTLTMLSKAIMWILVRESDRREAADMVSGLSAAERGGEGRRENILLLLLGGVVVVLGLVLCGEDSKLRIPWLRAVSGIMSSVCLHRWTEEEVLQKPAAAREVCTIWGVG